MISNDIKVLTALENLSVTAVAQHQISIIHCEDCRPYCVF